MFGASSYPDVLDLTRTPSVVALSAYAPLATVIRRGTTITRAEGRLVSENFFQTLGLRPAVGRLIVPADSLVGDAPVVVLSHAFWQRELAGEARVVGTTLEINGRTARVVGVTRAEFTGVEPGNVDVYLPMSADDAIARTNYTEERGARVMHAIGRLGAESSVDRAERDLNAIMRALDHEYPETNRGRIVSVRPADGLVDRNRTGAPIVPVSVLLFGASGIVLAVAAVNLASLVLTRSLSRRREIAVRLSLGAARARIMRQLLTESLVLAVGAELVAVLAIASLPAIGQALGAPPNVRFPVTPRVIGFVSGVTVAMTLAFALWPAWRATAGHVFEGLREGTGVRLSRARAHRVLAGTQVALSIVLLVCAGMLLQSLRRQQQVRPGFDATNLLAAEFEGAQGAQTQTLEGDFARTMLEKARALPGVVTAAVATNAPLTSEGARTTIGIPGYQPGADESMDVPFMHAGADYFATLGIPVVRGTEVSGAGDTVSRIVINESMARRYWARRDPVNSLIRLGGSGGRALQVVGVSADARVLSLAQPPAPRFIIQSRAGGGSTLLIKTRGLPETLLPTIQNDFGQASAAFLLVRVRTMDQIMGSSLLAAKALAGAVTLVGVLALSLAVCGLYAVVNYMSAQRTREFGVRLALGAERKDLFRLVLKSGATISAIGGVVGLALSVGAGAALKTLLYSVRMVDAATVVAVTLLMGGVVVIATLGPAIRAARTSPVEPLRAE
jgi:predicted permease